MDRQASWRKSLRSPNRQGSTVQYWKSNVLRYKALVDRWTSRIQGSFWAPVVRLPGTTERISNEGSSQTIQHLSPNTALDTQPQRIVLASTPHRHIKGRCTHQTASKLTCRLRCFSLITKTHCVIACGDIHICPFAGLMPARDLC